MKQMSLMMRRTRFSLSGVAVSITLAITFSASIVYGQETMPAAQRRNTIKVDVASNVLYRNAFILSYERTTKSNQSFGVSAGYQQFPQLLSMGESIRAVKEVDRGGFRVGGEYRFYLGKENKYNAPRGVYLGPYAGFNMFNNERNIEVTLENGNVKTGNLQSDLSLLHVGVQLGYQFVIQNRWTIDIVFIGPSVARYGAELKLDGDFSAEERQEYLDQILQGMIERFPLLGDLVQDQSVKRNGTTDFWSFGYRYQLSLGYHFGRKK